MAKPKDDGRDVFEKALEDKHQRSRDEAGRAILGILGGTAALGTYLGGRKIARTLSRGRLAKPFHSLTKPGAVALGGGYLGARSGEFMQGEKRRKRRKK